MNFQIHPLQEPLSLHIESIFHYSGLQPEHSIERVVPTGHLFILFELDDIPRNTFDNETLKPNGVFTKVWVSGMHKNYLSISAHNNAEMLVVQFKTKGAYPCLSLPIHTINDKVVPAEQLFGSSILGLRNSISKDTSAQEKFKLVEDWLLENYKKENEPNIQLLKVLQALQTKPYNECKSITEQFPNTQKHLINQFKMYFGLTPKVLHRIYRFNLILQQIRNKDEIRWSDIAYEFGFSDQSHFIKEFKAFSGFNPQEFIKSDYHQGEPNFFPVDKDND